MSEFLTEFAVQLILFVILGVGGAIFTYFINLKRCLNKHKKETDTRIEKIDDRTIRFAKAFIHFVKRNDELHANKKDGTPNVKLSDEVDNILRDEKGNL